MAETSSIEWTDATWNPIAGCSLKSPGCAHCYAMPTARRHELMMAALGRVSPYAGLTRVVNGKAVWTGEMRLVEAALTLPLRWQRPRRIFVNSMSDLFHEDVPDEWINRVFAVMNMAPQHTFQVLTKRSARMRAYFKARREGDPWAEAADEIADLIGLQDHPSVLEPSDLPLRNVWLGVSAEDQRRADERVPDLLATPAAVRFVSAEPLLGPIRFDQIRRHHQSGVDLWNALTGFQGHRGGGSEGNARLDWIIAGGESGPGARPMHPDWARQIRDACAAAGVAYLFKQWGAYVPAEMAARRDQLSVITSDGMHLRGSAVLNQRDDGAAEIIVLVGKKAAGRLLDGVEHNGFPEVSRG